MISHTDKTIRYNQGRLNGTIMLTGKHWKWYQPNDHRTGDCVIRAYSKFAGVDWLTAFDTLVPIARKYQENLYGVLECVKTDIPELNLEYHTIPIVKGQKRMTVEEFCLHHPVGNYFVRIANHTVAVVDGYYHDIWECGDSAIVAYFTKSK